MLDFGPGCFLYQISYHTAFESIFSPRCARAVFFRNPAPARGGPSAFSENWSPPLRLVFVLHTKRRRWLFVKSKTSVFEWVVDARFFRTPLFIAGAPGPPKGTATEKQPVKSPVEDLNHNSEPPWSILNLRLPRTVPKILKLSYDQGWSFAMIAWTRKEPRTRRNPTI